MLEILIYACNNLKEWTIIDLQILYCTAVSPSSDMFLKIHIVLFTSLYTGVSYWIAKGVRRKYGRPPCFADLFFSLSSSFPTWPSYNTLCKTRVPCSIQSLFRIWFLYPHFLVVCLSFTHLWSKNFLAIKTQILGCFSSEKKRDKTHHVAIVMCISVWKSKQNMNFTLVHNDKGLSPSPLTAVSKTSPLLSLWDFKNCPSVNLFLSHSAVLVPAALFICNCEQLPEIWSYIFLLI